MKKKKIEKVPLIKSMIKTIEVLAHPEILDSLRKDIFRLETNNLIIDTCIAYDTMKWETGVQRKINDKWEDMKVVEQYSSREEAIKGQEKWELLLKENFYRELPSLSLFE